MAVQVMGGLSDPEGGLGSNIGSNIREGGVGSNLPYYFLCLFTPPHAMSHWLSTLWCFIALCAFLCFFWPLSAL